MTIGDQLDEAEDFSGMQPIISELLSDPRDVLKFTATLSSDQIAHLAFLGLISEEMQEELHLSASGRPPKGLDPRKVRLQCGWQRPLALVGWGMGDTCLRLQSGIVVVAYHTKTVVQMSLWEG